MKVLFLTNIPSPGRVDFFRELSGYCELTVLYELTSSKERDPKWRSRYDVPGEQKGYQEIYLKPIWRGAAAAWCPSVRKYLKRRDWDIVIVGVYSTPTGMYAISFLKHRKLPYAINCDGGFAASRENPLKYRLKKFLLSKANLYFCSGKFADAYLTYYGADAEAIRHYPFTTLHEKDILKESVTEQEKTALKEKLEVKEEKMILSVGNFIHRKGFDILIKAAAELEEQWGVYIIGGVETEEYKQIIEHCGIKNVHFQPFMSSEELKNYYMAADVFVLPTREDIWGLVINEAMAAGLPVITTNKCGAGLELLEEEFLVPVEDAKALYTKIKLLMEDDDLRKKTGCRNLEKIREYTIENMARVHADILACVDRGMKQ